MRYGRAEHAGDDADGVAGVERELADEVGDEHEERADEPGRQRAATPPGPTMRAAIGPAMKATKAIGPVAARGEGEQGDGGDDQQDARAADVHAEARRPSRRRVAARRGPRPCDEQHAARARRTRSRAGATTCQVAPLRLPVSHCIAVCRSHAAACDSTYVTTLSSIAATPMPMRMSRAPAKPPRLDEQVDRDRGRAARRRARGTRRRSRRARARRCRTPRRRSRPS